MELQTIHLVIAIVIAIASGAGLYVAGERGLIRGGQKPFQKLEGAVAMIEKHDDWFNLPETVLTGVVGVDVLAQFNELVIETRAEVRELHTAFQQALERTAGLADRALMLLDKVTDGKQNTYTLNPGQAEELRRSMTENLPRDAMPISGTKINFQPASAGTGQSPEASRGSTTE